MSTRKYKLAIQPKSNPAVMQYNLITTCGLLQLIIASSSLSLDCACSPRSHVR